MKKEYMSPELTLVDLKSPVIMDVEFNEDPYTKSATDEFDNELENQ